jgi:hypothetical protein
MSGVLVLLLMIAGAATLWLVHRDGIEIGREQATVERERRLRNLSRLQDQHRKVRR